MKDSALKELLEKPNGQWSERIALIIVLTLFGLAMTPIILAAAGESSGMLYLGNQYLAFSLRHGNDRLTSWIGHTQSTHQMWVSLASRTLILCLLLFMSRYMAWINLVCRATSSQWICCVDFAIAGHIIRMFNDLRGYINMLFIHIPRQGITFDLVDCYLGIFIAVFLVWIVLCELQYLRLKKQKTAGMNFFQKMKWEFVFVGIACKMSILPTKKWTGLVEEYGYKFEEDQSE